MVQILASGKNGTSKYDNKSINPQKVFTRLDARQIAQTSQNALEQTQGYSLSGNEGSPDALNELSTIDVNNMDSYDESLSKIIQTFVANNSYLDVDGASTANNIILIPRKISNITAPDSNNYSKFASLPFSYRDNLRFVFRATATNTGAVQISIPSLVGLSGAIDVVDESGTALTAGDISINRFYEIYCTGTSGTKKFILRKVVIPSATNTTQGIVELLTDAELQTGTDTTRVPTASNIASLFGASSRASNGYIRIPVKVSGAFVEIIMQWGLTTSKSPTATTFPLAFPNACLSVVATLRNYTAGIDAPAVISISTSSFTANWDSTGTGVYWIAIGY